MLRYFYYKRHLNSLGDNVKFSFGVILSEKNISIGSNVRFGVNTTIANCSFGNNVHVAQNCHFLSGKNQHSHSKLNVNNVLKKISLGNDIWIGASVVVMDDVGDNVVVGAGAVVTKSIENNSVVAGVPARTLK